MRREVVEPGTGSGAEQATTECLARVLRGRSPSEFERRLVDVLHDDVFRRVPDLRTSEACALTYHRLRHLNERMGFRIRELSTDVEKLLALHDWVSLVDGTLTTLLTIHLNLCAGSILQHGEGRPELEHYLDELERMDSVGVFLATELGYGNNVQALETRAVYDHEVRSFVLETPTAAARKFMPNTGAEGIPKLAVVMARLEVGGEDCGVYPFIVRIRTALGPCPGVSITPLGEKPDYALDNAITTFEGVRIPKEDWLSGADSRIDDDGRFTSRISSPRRRFLHSMDRVQAGKLCLAVAGLSMLRGSLRLTLGYALERRSFAPGQPDVPVLSYRPYQRAVFRGLATAYASAAFLEEVAAAYAGVTTEDATLVYRLLAIGKVFVSSRALSIHATCRERMGAQGLFSVNRVVSYWLHTNGIVTAEGDNEVLRLKAARELLLGSAYTLPEEGPPVPPLLLLESADAMIGLLSGHERRLVLRLREAIQLSLGTETAFEAWNTHLSEGMALVSVHAARLALEAFQRAVDRAEDVEARELLDRLLRLLALEEVERVAADLLAEGVIHRDAVARLQIEQDRICKTLFHDAQLLIDAFGLPDTLLDSPLTGDYVRTYDRMASEPPRTSFIRVKDVGHAAEKVGAG